MPYDPKSKHSLSRWDIALLGDDNSLLERLIRDEPPAVVYRKFKEFVTASYHMIGANPHDSTRQLPEDARAGLEESIRDRINRKMPYFDNFRQNLGWPIQELNIAHLHELRKSNSLTLVAGAGVTIDAGGPSWAELVRELLTILLDAGREIVTEKLVPRRPGRPGLGPGRWADYEMIESKRVIGPYPELVRNEAENIIEAIEPNPDAVSDEILKNGAQLCLDVLGNDLFTHVASSIYRKTAGPGSVHRAIAELARPQIVTHNDGVTKERTMGWDFIFTYNFDDLIGEAMLEKNLPFARMASRGGRVYGDPSDPSLDESRDLHLKIVHLHGYTPHRLFNLEGIDFVFSMSQFFEHTRQGKRNLIIQTFKDQFVDEPLRTLLYVGCSFSDETMDELLQEAHKRFPGLEHFAILRLPSQLCDKDSVSSDELARISEEHRQRGIEPIWVRKFEEIPQVLKRLE